MSEIDEAADKVKHTTDKAAIQARYQELANRHHGSESASIAGASPTDR